jgi:TRAP-type mannitol/chloroaromatic compound transport system permease large subunit
MQSDLAAYDGRSIVLNIVSFLLPPLGLVLYISLMMAKLPQKATSVGRSATFGLVPYLLYVVVALVVMLATEYSFHSQSEPAVRVQAASPALVQPPRP